MMTPNGRNWRWLPVVSGLTVSHSHAAPIEGEIASNAAALLVILGIWALVMGVRNLRELRYKRLLPHRQNREEPLADIEAGDRQQTQ